MNSDEIDRFLRVRLRDFDGVFSIDRLPDHPHLLVCNTALPTNPVVTGSPSTSTMKDEETFSIRLGVDLVTI